MSHLSDTNLPPATNPPPMALSNSGVGKRGYLRLGFELGPEGRTILRTLDRRHPMVVQQALYWDEQLPHLASVYTLSSGGPLVDGDRYRWEVKVGPGAEAHVASGAATLIASMRYDRVEIEQRVEVAEGGYLEWLPEPTIPCARSHSLTTTELTVAHSGALFWADMLCCGRLYYGERFDFERLFRQTTLRRPDGQVVAREVADSVPSVVHPSTMGILGDFTHWATVVMVGPSEVMAPLNDNLRPYYTPNGALGTSLIGDSEAVVVRLLGHSAEGLKREVRGLCSQFRMATKGVPLDADFPWR